MPKRAIALVAAIVFTYAIAVAGLRVAVKGDTLMGDFRAFYCAARVTASHDSPYEIAAMGTCEAEPVTKPLFRTVPPMEVPAPLPGYVIAAFMPFAVLPYTIAAIAWFATLAIAGVLSCLLLTRLTWASFPTALVALSVPLFVVSLPVGELPPIALLGVLVSVCAVRSKRPWVTAVGVALCMVEPQIGLPLAIAVACADRRSWLPLASAAVILSVLSLAALGWNKNLEYMFAFLPAHVTSELPRVQQYTIGWALHQIGTSTAVSLWVGRIAYAVVLIGSALLGRAFARTGKAEVACVFVPVLALLGGPFVHVDHLLLAFPAALWCAHRADSRVIGIFSTLALSLPLASIFAYPPLVCAVPIVALTIGREYFGTWIAAVRTAGASTIVAATIFTMCNRYGFGFTDATATLAAQPSTSRSDWSRYILAHNVVTSWTIWTIKAPVWAALLTLAGAGAQRSRRGQSR